MSEQRHDRVTVKQAAEIAGVTVRTIEKWNAKSADMSDPFNSVRVALGARVRRVQADKLEACCPAHDDQSPSLGVKRRSDGVVLITCRAGCDTKNVLSAIGLQMTDLFPERPQGVPRPQPVETRAYRDLDSEQPEKTYTYRGYDGEALYYMLRYSSPKAFRPRALDGSKTLDGVQRVPYELPELIGKKDIFITEGEKDADRLIALGVPATTNAFGAMNWTAELSEILSSIGVQRVFIPPDNDVAGKARAKAVAAHCVKAGIEARIVPLDGLTEKQDVSDWLDNGGTLEQLQQLAEQAPIFDPARDGGEQADESEAWFEDGPSFQRYALEPSPPMLVEGLLPGDGVALLHGDPRSFKTFVALDMALAVASGTPALTTLATGQPSPVLYISNEDGQQRTSERLAGLMRARSLDRLPELLKLAVHRVTSLDDTEWKDRVCAMVTRHGIRLVILDPLRSLTSAVDQGPRELQPFAEFFRRLSQLGCVVLLVHHDTKHSATAGRDGRAHSQRVSGGGLFSKSDSPIRAERVGDEPSVLLHPNAWKFSDPPSSLRVDLTVANGMTRLTASPTALSSTSAALDAQILDYLAKNPAVSGKQIKANVRGRGEGIDAALRRLETLGVLVSKKGRHNAKLWSLAAAEKDQAA